MSARRQAGFTLIELVVAMALLATMLLLLYGGLNFSLRSWDAGDTSGRRTADRRVGENFLRRELADVFPLRWKEPMTLKFAFLGAANKIQFVSARPASAAQGGLSLVSLEVEQEPGSRKRNLVMRRAMPDDEATDFGPLDKAERTILIADVDSATFEYFGAENDFNPPRWADTWAIPYRMPEMVRLRLKDADGMPMPEIAVKVQLGEEAGCLENVFQRSCRPRRP